MIKGEVWVLFDIGFLYVAHFEDLEVFIGLIFVLMGEVLIEEICGTGRWIEISLDSIDMPPNAAVLGAPDTTVGQVF